MSFNLTQVIPFFKDKGAEILLFAFTVFNIFLLFPMLQEGFLYGDDNTSNYAYTVRLAEMIQAGNFRLWLSDYSMGQPLFFYYQPIPHLITALLYLALPFIEPLFLYKLMVLIVLVCIPLSVYKGMKWMSFQKAACLLGALLVCSIHSWRSFGFELYTLFNWGQYAHIWGLALTPLAIGYCYKTFFGNRKLFVPCLLLGLLFLTHAIVGMIACISVASLYLISAWNAKQKWQDAFYLTKLFTGVFCIAAVILVPNVLYADYADGFSTLDRSNHLGVGIKVAFEKLFTGAVFDKGSLPVVTILLGLGLLISSFYVKQYYKQAVQQEEKRQLSFLLLNFFIAFFLICGARTFPFLKETPLISSIPVLRLLPYWHLFSLFIVCFGITKIWKYSKSESSNSLTEIRLVQYIFQLSIVALVFYVGFRQYDAFDKKTRVRNHVGINSQDKSYKEVLSFLEKQEPGRLHMSGIKTHLELHLPPLLAGKPVSKFYAASSHTNLGLFYLTRMDDAEINHYNLFGLPYLLTKNGSTIHKKNNGKSSYVKPEVGKSTFKNAQYEIFKTPANSNYFDVVHSNTAILSNNHNARNLLFDWMNTPKLLEQKEHIAIAGRHSKDFFVQQDFQQFIEVQNEDIDGRKQTLSCTIENRAEDEKIEVQSVKGVSSYLSHQITNENSPQYGNVLDETFEEGYYKATLNIPAQANNKLTWAMLKINAHPDWKAKVDEEEVDWIQMSPCFMAVPVTKGTHTVEFEFTISPLRKALFLLCILTITGLGLFEYVPLKTSYQKLKKMKKIYGKKAIELVH